MQQADLTAANTYLLAVLKVKTEDSVRNSHFLIDTFVEINGVN